MGADQPLASRAACLPADLPWALITDRFDPLGSAALAALR